MSAEGGKSRHLLDFRDVSRTYAETPPVVAVAHLTLTISRGEFVAFVGPSGSGKSSLLNLAALLDRPSGGRYLIDGVDTTTIAERQRSLIRSATFGFVFQSFHLLDRHTAAQNVELGLLYQGQTPGQRRARALEALERVGMIERAHHPANKLSGGERQRVAIARALVGGAPVLVADEPTGNLDTANSQAIVELFRELHESGTTIVMVTHDLEVASAAQRQIELRDGRIDSDGTHHAHEENLQQTEGYLDAGRARLRDVIADALRSGGARRGRALALVAAVAVAAGLVVATLGLSQTAAAQVSEQFDLRRNREVTVRASAPIGGSDTVTGAPVLPDDAEARIRRLAGVDDVGLLTNLEQQLVSASPQREPRQVIAMAVSPGLLDTVGATIAWTDNHPHQLGNRELLVGELSASQLDLAPLSDDPTLVVDGIPYVVVGVINDVQRSPELLTSIVVGQQDAVVLGAPTQTDVLIRTASGAAQQVAQQAPVALDPVDPDRFDVNAPVDPTSLRTAIESDVTATMLILSLVAFIASVIGITNTMTMGVVERTSEFGLRRALGARQAHILLQVIVESLTVGAIGGLIGLYVGFGGTLTVTLIQRWQPVLDLRLVPLALLSGALAGVLGGLTAGWRASHIQPIDALRQ